MRGRTSIFFFVLILIIALALAGCGGKPQQKPSYKDGEYTGRYETDRGNTEVKVTVRDGKIANIEIVEPDAQFAIEDNWPAHIVAREQIPQRIIAAQSAEVEAVSKATGTSNSLMKATADALNKAKK